MAKLIIRKAKMRDIPQLIKIVKGVSSIEDYPGEYNRAYFNKMLNRNNVLVAEINAKIVGFIEFEWDKDARRVFLESLAVLKKFRGQGIGSKLFGKIELFAKDHKAKRMSMLVRNWNKDMNKLAKKKGFLASDVLYLLERKLK